MTFMPSGSIYTGLKCDSIGGGSVINLRATDVTYGHSNLISNSPEPSRAIGSPYNYRLPVGVYTGHAAPTISITGNINADSPDTGDITLQLLGSFARCGSPMYFWDKYVMDFVPVGSLMCFNNSVKLSRTNRTQGTDYGYFIDYNITLQETRDDTLWTDPTE